jgi:hypothetical protein
MTNVDHRVNWVKDIEYREPVSAVLNAYFTELRNSGKEIYFYDALVSDNQPDEYLRELDDSPGTDLFWFLKFYTASENIMGFSKKQKDGATLICISESYPGMPQFSASFCKAPGASVCEVPGATELDTKRFEGALHLLVRD